MISDGAWRRFFGASPAIVGRELRVTRAPITIVGVMPAGFRGLSARADAWLPHLLAPGLSFSGYLTSTEYFTLEDLAATGRGDRRFLLILLGLCAALGLFLSAIGVFAMTASWMEARRKELGMRIALGAQPAGLVRLVMRATMTQAAMGVAGGIVLAFIAGRALDATLFGVAPHDPRTLAGAGLAMLAVSGIAAYVPARRALRLDPVREISAE